MDFTVSAPVVSLQCEHTHTHTQQIMPDADVWNITDIGQLVNPLMANYRSAVSSLIFSTIERHGFETIMFLFARFSYLIPNNKMYSLF